MSATKGQSILQELTPIKSKYEIVQSSAPDQNKRIFRLKRAISTQKVSKNVQSSSSYLFDQPLINISSNEKPYFTEKHLNGQQNSITDFQSLVANHNHSKNNEDKPQPSPSKSFQKIILRKKRAITQDDRNSKSSINIREKEEDQNKIKMPHLRSTSAFDRGNKSFQQLLNNMQIIENVENKKNALPLTSEQQFQEEIKKFENFLNSERLVQDKNLYEEYERLNEKMRIEMCAGMNKLVKLKVRGCRFPIRFTVYTNGGYYTIYFKDSYPQSDLCQSNSDYEMNKMQKFINLYDKRTSKREIKYIFCNITFQTYCLLEINAIEAPVIKSMYSTQHNMIEALKKFKQEKLKKEKKTLNVEEYHDFMREIEAIKLRKQLQFAKMFPNAQNYVRLNKKDLDSFRWKKDEILEKNKETREQRTELALEKKDNIYDEKQQFREQWLQRNEIKKMERIMTHKQYIRQEWVKLINFLNFITIIKNAHITAKIVRIFSKSMENKINRFLVQNFRDFQKITVNQRQFRHSKLTLTLFTQSIKKKTKLRAGKIIQKLLVQITQQNSLKQHIIQTIQKVVTIQKSLRNFMFVPRQFLLKKLWDEIVNDLTFTDKRRKNVLGEFISENINPFTIDKYIKFHQIREPQKCTYTQLINLIDGDLRQNLIKQFRKLISQVIAKSYTLQTEEKEDLSEIKKKKNKSPKAKKRKKTKILTRKRELSQIEESPQNNVQSNHIRLRSDSKLGDDFKSQDNSSVFKKTNSIICNSKNNNQNLQDIYEQNSSSSFSIQETPNLQSTMNQFDSIFGVDDLSLNVRKLSSSSILLNPSQQQEDLLQKAQEIQLFDRKFIQPQTYQDKKKLQYNIITFSKYCNKYKLTLQQKIFKEMERIRLENKWEI